MSSQWPRYSFMYDIVVSAGEPMRSPVALNLGVCVYAVHGSMVPPQEHCELVCCSEWLGSLNIIIAVKELL